jgi:hypothetical protein
MNWLEGLVAVEKVDWPHVMKFLRAVAKRWPDYRSNMLAIVRASKGQEGLGLAEQAWQEGLAELDAEAEAEEKAQLLATERANAVREAAKPAAVKQNLYAEQIARIKAREEAKAKVEAEAEPLFIYPEIQPEAEDTEKEQAQSARPEPEPSKPTFADILKMKPEDIREPQRPKTKKAEPLGEAPAAPLNAGPEALTYPRGLLGHATQYVYETSSLPDRWLSLTAALSALAKGTDRRVLGPGDTSTVLWLLLIAESGAGKQHALHCIRTLLRAMGLERSYAASGLGSVQGIEEILEGRGEEDGNPNPLVVMDEVGAWLKRISSKGQTGNVSEIPGLLQSLWGWSMEAEWMGSKTKGKEMRSVMGPAFSIYGASTEKKLMSAVSTHETGRVG